MHLGIGGAYVCCEGVCTCVFELDHVISQYSTLSFL